MIWVTSSDSNHCRIYFYQRKPASLKLVKEIIHSEFRLKKSECLTTDRPGHYQTKDTARGAYSPPTDPKEVEINNFAREVARALNQGRKQKLFNKLVIIAAPHINGLILQHLNKNVKNLLVDNIKKDLLHTTDQKLLKYLHENVYNFGVNL